MLLGQDAGANPVEYVLHALAGCITTTFVYHAAARGIRVTEVESRLEGDLDVRGILDLGGARNGFERIRVTMRVKADATEQEIRELLAYATDRSPVVDIVSNTVPITMELA